MIKTKKPNQHHYTARIRYKYKQNCPGQLWGPPRLPLDGYQDSSLRGVQPGCKVYHSTPSSGMDKK